MGLIKRVLLTSNQQSWAWCDRLKIYLQNKVQVFQLKYEMFIALQISNTFSTFEQIYFHILTLNIFTTHNCNVKSYLILYSTEKLCRNLISNAQSLKVHIQILRRPQKFAKSSPYFWLQYIKSKTRGRFCKILCPSQNKWTLEN